METCNRFECIKHVSTTFKMETAEVIPFAKGMGGICRPHRDIFPHSHSSKVSKPSVLSCRKTFFQSSTFRYSDDSYGMSIWHRPMVDMFATKMNNKLPLYVSPVSDPNAMVVDTLNISWEALDGYAYCPIALIPKMIQKMRTYACQMIVVAPG